MRQRPKRGCDTIVRGADLHHMPVLHDRDPVRDRHRLFLVMCHKDRGRSRGLQQLAHLLPGFDAHRGVQVRKGFIQQHQGRRDSQCARQRHALLLAARQFMWLALFQPRQPHQRQHFGHTVIRLRPRHAVQAEADIVAHT